MVYEEEVLIHKLYAMMKSHENEVVEFKEAKSNFSFNDIGKYFSALSNEANLRALRSTRRYLSAFRHRP